MPAVLPQVTLALAFASAHLMALPGLAIALYLYLVGRVAGSGGWLAALFELLFSGVVVLPVVAVCALLLLVTGLFASLRPWASVVLVAINLAVLAVSWTISPPANAAALVVWMPAWLSLALASALAWHGFSA